MNTERTLALYTLRSCCEGDPCEQPKQLSDADLEPCTGHRGYDYFAGSEISYITAVTALALVPFGRSTSPVSIIT